MAKFHKNEEHDVLASRRERVLSKEELDAKHEAAMEEKSIVSWKSSERIYKIRSKNYFTKVALYGLIFILAAIAFGQFFFVGVILSLIFVVYVLATAVPGEIEHRITKMGIVSGGKAFLWEELYSFWFEKRDDERLLVVQTMKFFPSQLIILLSTVSERTLLDIIEKHLHYHAKPVETLFDKWAKFLQSKVNLN